MKTRQLSPCAREAILKAQRIAEDYGHDELDSSHLFRALAEDEDLIVGCFGKTDTLDMASLLQDLERDLDRWHSSTLGNQEPSASYLETMHLAQQLATEACEHELTAARLLEATLTADERLAEWLSDRDITLTAPIAPVATPLLDQLGRNLSELARAGKLNRVIGRDHEVEEIIEILLRRGKNSVLLLGKPGVGKTSIVEALAQRIADGSVPARLKDTRLIELSVSSLVAGTAYRGQFEERMRELLREAEQSGTVILVVDEFHSLMGTGRTSEGGTNAADILKPALARGRVTCIGITTNSEYAQHVERDGALERRFQPIRVPEPSFEETARILRFLAPEYEEHHQTVIDEETLTAVIELAADYLPTRRFPDKAVDVLGKVCSRAELQRVPVTPDLVASVVSDISGVPTYGLDECTREILANLEEELTERIVGQSDAIASVSSALRVAFVGLRDSSRPRAVFLFVGPTGVGKTKTALSLAEILFQERDRLIRLDMSEYSERIDVSRLVGAAPGYVGYEEAGQLTQPLRERPHSVVLLDEIEKAHPQALDILLQLFDEGRLTDSHGRAADGRHAIFVMTSNLLTQGAPDSGKLGFSPVRDAVPLRTSSRAIEAFFRPEFLNRIDQIVRFRALDADDLAQVAELEMEALVGRLEKKRDIHLTYETPLLELAAQHALMGKGGGRSVTRFVNDRVSVPISDALLQTDPDQVSQDRLHLSVNRGQVSISWD